jgi:ferrochelatase
MTEDWMSKKIGVVLLNLGGPEKQADVEPFLYNLFSDRKIIRLGPKFMQKPIARFIAHRRAPKSARSYALIGGGSPLNRITGEQGQALADSLAEYGDFQVDMAMRYWQPSAGETLAKLAGQGIKRLVALTLYPHYSRATTGSSLDDLRQVLAAAHPDMELLEIASWPDQPDYVGCLARTITEGLAAMDNEAQLVYSAHSLPVSFIKEGDPYLLEMDKTIRGIEKITGVSGKLCFQSRSGPVEWLAPSTPDMLRSLAGEDCNKVLMVPISFVSDHVETLYEIDIEYGKLAKSLGLELRRTESLNIKLEFIAGLKNMVVSACQEKGWL